MTVLFPSVRELSGEAIHQALDAIAELRITVFREFPYLYDGSPEYERSYLEGLAKDPSALVVVAESEGKIIAAATSLPLAGSADITQNTGALDLFRNQGLDPNGFYYFSEIVVLPAFRKFGIAKSFYERRCKFAQEHGLEHLCFAAILPEPHHQAPATYFSPHPLWRKMGFEPKEALTILYTWPTLQTDGTTREETHSLRFWVKLNFSST